MVHKILPIVQTENMASTTNRKQTNKFASPKKFIPDVKSKHFKSEWT